MHFACLSLTGQNFGAMKYDRIKESYLVCIKYGFIMMIIGGFVIFFGSNYLMKIFTDDINVIQIGSYYLKISALFIPAYTALQISISLMQGLKKPIYTSLLVFLKKFWELLLYFGFYVFI